MDGPIELEKFNRAKFLDSKKDPTVLGIVLDKQLEMGMTLYTVIIESRGDDVIEESDGSDALGVQQFWDYEAIEVLGFVSMEELLIHDKESIRQYAQKAYKESLVNPDPELIRLEKSAQLKQQIAEASDEELDRIIDSL